MHRERIGDRDMIEREIDRKIDREREIGSNSRPESVAGVWTGIQSSLTGDDMMEKRESCPFMDGWENQEGWLVQENGNLVCLDWDEYCTLCRKDDSKDCYFEVLTS